MLFQLLFILLTSEFCTAQTGLFMIRLVLCVYGALIHVSMYNVGSITRLTLHD